MPRRSGQVWPTFEFRSARRAVGVLIAVRFDETTLTSETREAFEAVAHADPSVRYELMQAAFAEQGVSDWSCPELQAYWADPTE